MTESTTFQPINMDRSQRVVIITSEQHWLPAPQAPIERLPLEREAPEQGQTTSFVRYLPGARFPQHTHPMGEEILVLEGVFSDESGDYPAGSYLRNPPGSSHAPFSEQGCLIFVKLNQFAATDTEVVRIRPQDQQWRPGIGNLRVCPLHEHQGASTAFVHWPAGEVFQPHRHWGGEEIVVIKGCFRDEHGAYPAYSWLRSPHLSQHHPFVNEETLILVKVGHI